MKINTKEYEFTHGRKPRGRGHWHVKVTGINEKDEMVGEQYHGLIQYGDLIGLLRNKYECQLRCCEIEVMP